MKAKIIDVYTYLERCHKEVFPSNTIIYSDLPDWQFNKKHLSSHLYYIVHNSSELTYLLEYKGIKEIEIQKNIFSYVLVLALSRHYKVTCTKRPLLQSILINTRKFIERHYNIAQILWLFSNVLLFAFTYLTPIPNGTIIQLFYLVLSISFLQWKFNFFWGRFNENSK